MKAGFCPAIGENLDNLVVLLRTIDIKDLVKLETTKAMKKTLELCSALGYNVVVHDIWEIIKWLIG